MLLSCSTKEKIQEDIIVEKETKVEVKDLFKDFLRHYEQFFTTNFNISGCPGAALVIVKDTTVVFKKGFGVKEINTRDSVDVNTVFRIASLSKGITAVLAGNLVDHDQLRWDQLIKESVTRFGLKDVAQADRLQINHVLSHTTGLYQYTHTKLIERGLPLERIIPRFRWKGVVAREGTEYEYQNAVFSVVEKVMENNTEKTFDELLKERLFVPAGMCNASSSYTEIIQNTNVALPHTFNHYAEAYKLVPIHKNYYNVAAAGGVNASISDMGEYLKVLLGLRSDIISKQALEAIYNPMICTSTEDVNVNYWDGVTDSFYGKGYRIIEYRGRTLIYHSGNVNQYKSELLVDREHGIAVCALFNAPNSVSPVVIPAFLNYYDFYRDLANK